MCLFQTGLCFKSVWYCKRIWDDSLYFKDNFGKIHLIFSCIYFSNNICRLNTGPQKLGITTKWERLNLPQTRWRTILKKSFPIFPMSRLLKSENLSLNWYTKVHILAPCNFREWNSRGCDFYLMWPLSFGFSKVFEIKT